MLLTADWLRERGKEPAANAVLIVDHGLRDGSAKESALVAGWARRAGFDAHLTKPINPSQLLEIISKLLD